jgi:polyhydroxyalkanoate synthesis regulator phasin
MATLQEIAQNGGWAAAIANEALTIKSQMDSGELSADEGKELLEDLARLEGVVEASDDIETKTDLVTAIFVVAKVV